MDKDFVTKTSGKASEPALKERDSGVDSPASGPATDDAPREIGGRGGLDPVRYGDWEKNGRCIDF